MSDQPLDEEAIRQRVREAMRRAQPQKKEKKADQRPDGTLLPILRSTSSSPELDLFPHVPVLPGTLFATFAHVGMTPQGKIGMHHVLRAQLGERSAEDLLSEATANLMSGIKAQMRGTDDTPDRMVSLEREGYFAASAVVAPDFHEWISGLLGENRLVVALPSPDQIYIAGADSYWADQLARMVLDSEYEKTPLTPTLLLSESTGLELIVEQPVS
ncbi:hypothetical protein NLX83_03770 [Allokutzneria sp. A3M-2-11 16]|uniref:hypothetical protein n=1 Tax=Allokutzneria sp. A3M-2-11 16 TaxID=2962043 RepID=UPI0020B8E644|nr:hypothetical protein [Allokutzneria sp. A3M-2-11 16]MCP3798370.1 hypothetical protein [Allokutzneria sp. A3M-2-11 16]